MIVLCLTFEIRTYFAKVGLSVSFMVLDKCSVLFDGYRERYVCWKLVDGSSSLRKMTIYSRNSGF